MTYRRPVSGTERVWIVAEQRFGGFCNQMVIEGEGAVDPEALKRAVVVAGQANPGAQVVLRGLACKARWEDAGGPPPVRVVQGDGWDGRSDRGAPFVAPTLDLRRGPTTEVVLVQGDPAYVVVRTAHATMDGGGTLAFAHDLFRVLRGEAPVGHTDEVTEISLARESGSDTEKPPQADAHPPGGKVDGPLDGVVWRRATIEGRVRGALGVVGARLARRAMQSGPARLDVPADLRRNHPEVRSTANLTGIVHLDVEAADPAQITQMVRDAVAQREDARAVRSLDGVRHVPLWLMRWVSRQGQAVQQAQGTFGATAVVSNMGRMDLDAVSAPGFQARSVWFVPPGTPVTAAFLTMSGTADRMEILATVPTALASDGRLDELMDELVDALNAAASR